MSTPYNFSQGDAPIELQTSFWNRWNADHRENQMNEISARQAEVILGWLEDIGRRNLDILDVGCGSGWFAPGLSRYGVVTATDLSDEVLNRAARRWPQANFIAGDFMALDLGISTFDVIVSLEVLPHVFDQKAFIQKLSTHLRPGGLLMLATQNRYVLEKYNSVSPPAPGQLRRWVYKQELANLLAPEFESLELFTVSPIARVGIMRWVNSRKLNAPIRAIFGSRVERMKERAGLGWTLMSLSKKAR
ncbi:class I SAM-dependent methyltransferase [Mesorhizobium sp. NZP2077]|uniref:class I SAM-dependent methyltransferase n=1 Tax=Mesorhizobium sp. NZP2077 TaxID=2483404 RepID=UPI0015533384|nr:class I SAM-dependent methyltransferase [Mesorhizobium sp. NZP2077]QKC81536.1 class I SAM-dependent methyltransferase [Mesorhizobium sp. NZP2077]QKD14986.1 class I SAM-dependent methyltransferase [Mesorhizobium sp. NZP2077]